MGLTNKTKNDIKNVLIRSIRNKLDNYSPETNYMPFHHRLLGADRYATFSLIHSMNTTFGSTVWEPMAVIIAKGAGLEARMQYKLKGQIDDRTAGMIDKIHFGLRDGRIKADKPAETKQIRDSIQRGEMEKDPDSTVDLYFKKGNEENYVDITSAKPNMKEFAVLKRKLLRWVGLRLSTDNTVVVKTRLGIPYNPYHPKPYTRWTVEGLLDISDGELLVGENFWNYIAGDDVYGDLLEIFSIVGEEMRGDIDAKFGKFGKLA